MRIDPDSLARSVTQASGDEVRLSKADVLAIAEQMRADRAAIARLAGLAAVGVVAQALAA